jgi:hypothetical protein
LAFENFGFLRGAKKIFVATLIAILLPITKTTAEYFD